MSKKTRVLLTGSTGFLGKRLLETLVGDSRVQSIDVISRRKLYHPSDKVKVHQIDLADPSCVPALGTLVAENDAVVHLAGLYDFSAGYSSNYQNNVLPAMHLVQAFDRDLRKKTKPIFFASTFAVGLGTGLPLNEGPLTKLAPKSFAYSHTKGLAERVLTDSGLTTYIFRLGALSGSPKDGLIEKIDGPYFLLKVLRQVSKFPGTRFLPHIPVLADPNGAIPLLPVDCAASIFHAALFHPQLAELKQGHFGAFETNCVNLREICEAAVSHFFPKSRAFFVTSLPKQFSMLEKLMTRGSAEIFEFSLKPVSVKNELFQKYFSEIEIPAFETYREVFFTGFENYHEDKKPC